MFTFLHAADFHLDSPLKGLEEYQDAPVENIRLASRRALDNLVRLAIDEKVAFVVIAGDLYDTDWKDYNTGLFFVSRVARLHEAGIPVIMVSGNHDAASQITRSLRLPSTVTLLPHDKAGSVYLDNFNVAIHGQSFATRFVTDDLVKNYPQADPALFTIGLLHTSLDGAQEPYAPTTLDALRSKGYHYWALGHIHKRMEVCREPWVVYSGNLQGRHIRERGAKGCTLVTVNNGEVINVEPRELDVFRWALCHLDISHCDSVDSIPDMVRTACDSERAASDGRPLAMRFVLEGTTPLHTALHYHAAHWTEEIRAVSATVGDIWLEKVLFNTKAPTATKTAQHHADSPLTELLDAVASWQTVTDDLTTLVPEFEKLRSKLPAELLNENDPFRRNPAAVALLRNDIMQLLSAHMEQH